LNVGIVETGVVYVDHRACLCRGGDVVLKAIELRWLKY